MTPVQAMQPERFGPYLLARKIATGGTAEIFLARRDGSDGFSRHIAIKRILPQYAEDTAFVQLLLDEARLAAHLHHGHIVQIHDVGQIDGQAYIAMEYLPGTDVGRLMQRAGERTRRVLVAHTDHELRKTLIRYIKKLDRDLEVVPAHDADEVTRRSADGAIDLAVVDNKLATLVVDRLASNHPELLRTIVVGDAPGLRPVPTTFITDDHDPRVLAEIVDCCMRAPMPLDIAMQIIRAVADGLDHAHTAVDYADEPLHIVHRDINPANVLVSKSGTVKLVDFGIARAMTGDEGPRKGFVGTYDYMSPEQTGKTSVDARSDLFSLGTLIHLLVTGEHPYKGDDMFATMRALREDPPPPLDARIPGTPALLVDIAMRAAEKDPDDRYPSAEAMLSDIEEVVRRSGINLSPKRLASYVRAIFGKDVKRFGVTTMSMPAVKVDDQGNVIPVHARKSINEVGRPVAKDDSVNSLVPILEVPAEPPPTLGPIKAVQETIDAADAEVAAEKAAARPATDAAARQAAPGMDAEAPSAPPAASDPLDHAATQALPGPSAVDDLLADAARAAHPVTDDSLTDDPGMLHPPTMPPIVDPKIIGAGAALPVEPARRAAPSPANRFTPAPVAVGAEDDGPTQVAPPSPEILAAIAAASGPRNTSPPPRAPDLPPTEAPAEHIARRLGAPMQQGPAAMRQLPHGRVGARPSYQGGMPGTPARGPVQGPPGTPGAHGRASMPGAYPPGMQRTPVGQRGSMHSLHSINAMGPPPSSRSSADDSAMRIVLGIVIGALVGLVALYIWWRTGNG